MQGLCRVYDVKSRIANISNFYGLPVAICTLESIDVYFGVGDNVAKFKNPAEFGDFRL